MGVRYYFRVLPHRLVLFFCLVAFGAVADIPNSVYQPPQDISADDRQSALEKLDRFVAKLKQLEAEIDRGRFDLAVLLDQKDFDQQKIITFVREEISFEQYPGLLRGARGSLISGAGNALDQALLLTTLLNDAGFDARIVHGRLGIEQTQQLLSGIGRDSGDTGHLAGNPQAWDARGAELHDISGAPEPHHYAPLEQAPFYIATLKATTELIQALHASDINMAEADSNSLVAEARDYFWVESRIGPSDEWQAHHPAFGAPTQLELEAVETFGHQVPESLQHRLKIEVFIEQRVGSKLHTHRVAGPWVRPVANLQGVVLSYFNHPNTLDIQAIKTGVEAALNKANLFVPVLNGEPGTAFDLNGSTVDIEALSMDDFGGAALFQTVGNKAGDAANALSAMGAADDNKNVDLMALTGHWIEYTLIRPGGTETTHRRMVMDLLGKANRTAGRIQLRHMNENDIRLALTVQHRFMVATGTYSEAYTAEQVLGRLIDSAPAWRLMVDYLYGGDVQLNKIRQLEPSPIPHLALYRTFDMGPKIIGAQIAYRASPSLIVLRDGLLPTERNFRSVDVVTNDRRVLVRDKSSGLRFNFDKAVAIGVWETAIETMAYDYFGPGSAENNTFAVFAAARQQGIKTLVLGPNTATASHIELDGDGRGYLMHDLETGHAVLIPEQTPVGLALTGWWRVDTATGTTLGMLADGRGTVIYEYLKSQIEMWTGLASSMAKYANCEKYKDTRTKACCLVEAHMDNVGGMALGGLMGASLGGAAGSICSAGGLIKGEIKDLLGHKKKEWKCRFFDADGQTMIGAGGIVNTEYMGCGLLQ